MNINVKEITKNHYWSQQFCAFLLNKAVDEECLAVKSMINIFVLWLDEQGHCVH